MGDQKAESGGEYPRIARRWRLGTAAFYGSIIALLLLLANLTGTTTDEASSRPGSWISSMADRRP